MSNYTLSYELADDQSAMLKLQGWVDFGNAPAILEQGRRLLAEGAANQPRSKIILDVSEVDTVQSVLLSILLRWTRELQYRHHISEMQVTGLSGQMGKMARVTGLDELLPVH